MMATENIDPTEARRELDEALDALDKMQTWIAAEAAGPEETPLQRHAFDMRVKAEEELWPLMVEAKALELMAARGPDDKPLAHHDAKYLATLMLRSDRLTEACITLEDLPEEALGGRSRWPIIAALKSVGAGVSEEITISVRELGLRD
jgi:hypothetical protein